jgi:hypothetical protein
MGEKPKWKAIGPLVNFRPEGDLEFADFQIRGLQEDELKGEFGENRDLLSFGDTSAYNQWPCFIMEYEIEEGEDPFQKTAVTVETLLRVLSLFKLTDTVLATAVLHCRPLQRRNGLGMQFGGSIDEDMKHPPAGAYLLSSQEKDALIEFRKKYLVFQSKDDKSSTRLKINMALRFLDRARRTAKLIERLIFLSVSLEALFSRELDELSYRYSHRAAVLLGKDSKQRMLIQKRVKDLYDLRSKVLHGNPKVEFNLKDVNDLYEIVRCSILRLISLYMKGYTNILDKLDDLIFDEENRNEFLKNATEYFGPMSELKYTDF